MAKQNVDFEVVRKIGLALPDVEDSTTPRGFALKVCGKLLACEAIHKSAEPHSLMVRISFDERERLLATEPGVYYLTDHYRGYPAILVRLPETSRRSLQDLLGSAWRFAGTKTTKTKGREAK